MIFRLRNPAFGEIKPIPTILIDARANQKEDIAELYNDRVTCRRCRHKAPPSFTHNREALCMFRPEVGTKLQRETRYRERPPHR
jgi:hypothetical protein